MSLTRLWEPLRIGSLKHEPVKQASMLARFTHFLVKFWTRQDKQTEENIKHKRVSPAYPHIVCSNTATYPYLANSSLLGQILFKSNTFTAMTALAGPQVSSHAPRRQSSGLFHQKLSYSP